MEPNDLKNPKGLKSSKNSDLKNSEKNIVSEEVKKREELHLPEKKGAGLVVEPEEKKELETKENLEGAVNVVKEEAKETAGEPVDELADATTPTPLETEKEVVEKEIEVAGKQEKVEGAVNVVKEEEKETAAGPVGELADATTPTPLETEKEVFEEEIEVAGKQEKVEKAVNVVKEEAKETAVEPVGELADTTTPTPLETEKEVVEEEIEVAGKQEKVEGAVNVVKEEAKETAVEPVDELADATTPTPLETEKEVVEEEIEVAGKQEKVEKAVNVIKEEAKETAAGPVDELADATTPTPLETEKEVVEEEIEVAGKQEKVEKAVNVIKEEAKETAAGPVDKTTGSTSVEKEDIATETDAEKVVPVTDGKEEKVEKEANVASKKTKPIVKKRRTIDYTNYSQIELVNALRDVLQNNETGDIKNEVEAIKSVFYKNLNEKTESAKKIFIDGGGLEEEFVAPEDPYENDIKNLLKTYREIRIDFNKRMENDKENNLKLKYEVIEKIKGLINSEESINKTFNDFRDLQDDWREIGLVPQSKMKNLWDTYHFHVENFYDYIKINRELRDLDLKKNLEIKIELCEHAEELLVERSIIKAFNILQKYHEQWRETGPVPREQKDNIWERFKSATSKINKKHQDFFESRKVEQKKNLDAKTALCEKVEEICKSEVTNYRDWDKKSRELVKLQKVWKTIGFAPKKDNNKIYERFRKACDKFFDSKRDFYSRNKEIQQNNLQLKIDLCVQAESLKDNEDWKKTTQDFINIQKKWKEIGPIPRKHSDNIWKRFRAACDFFFDKKSEHFSGMGTEQNDNLKKKEDLIEQAINFKSLGNVEDNLGALKNFQRQWSEIGHVPYKKKDEVQVKFRDAINKLFDDLNIDNEKRNLLKFTSKMSSYSESNRGQNKMRMEREKYINKLKQLESDHILLDNNIGFFAKSKNADVLIADIKKKLEISKQKIEFLKDKIRVIDEMDND